MIVQQLSQAGLDKYPVAHLLGIPYETRLQIYADILTETHNDREQCDGPPTSKYDGLRLTCKQLSIETSTTVFCYTATRHQLRTVLSIPANKLTFHKCRSLNLQIGMNLPDKTFACLAAFLNKFQLSIQELHLFFIGKDRHFIEVNEKGCAKLKGRVANRTAKELPWTGQEIEQVATLMRQVVNLRNMRILQLDNTNVPIPRTTLLANKPYLQVLSITADPRSQADTFLRMDRADARKALRGLLVEIDRLPPVQVLQLDANAIQPAEQLVNNLARSLRHFSWRVPSMDYHAKQEPYEDSFYAVTARLLQTLWRIPQLETLRLCISMRDLPENNLKHQTDMGTIMYAMRSYLHRFPVLQHLEVHHVGTDGYEHNFYRNGFIGCLPNCLRRLYISDHTISISRLVQLIRWKYFQDNRDEYQGNDNPGVAFNFGTVGLNAISFEDEQDERRKALRLLNLPVANYIRVNRRGYADYLTMIDTDNTLTTNTASSMVVRRNMTHSDDYLDDPHMIGEDEFRDDHITQNSGRLGFITFDYDATSSTIDDPEKNLPDSAYIESDRTKLFRLNGQLLDREHNFHLAATQSGEAEFGTKPKRVQPDPARDETALRSNHEAINIALHNGMLEFGYRVIFLKEVTRDLDECLGHSTQWYFGHENEAEAVFKLEPVATVNDQRQKSGLMEVEVDCVRGCQWASPDYDVPPVGSFPMPAIPHDWKKDSWMRS